MDLLGVLRACVRRWYVFLPIVVLTAWLGRDQYRQAQPEYTSAATVVIAPSTELLYNRGRQTETGIVITSPFNGGEGPRVLAGLLARALNTSTVRDQLLPAGGAAVTAARNVEEDPTLVTIQVVAATAEAETTALEAVRQGADGVLAQIQYDAGTPEGQLYVAVSGGPVDPPLVAYPDRVRGVVAIGLAGLLLAVVLSVVAQSLMADRRRREDKRAAKAVRTRTPRAPRAPRPPRAPKQPKRPKVRKARVKKPRPPSERGLGRRSVATGGAMQELDVRDPDPARSR